MAPSTSPAASRAAAQVVEGVGAQLPGLVDLGIFLLLRPNPLDRGGERHHRPVGVTGEHFPRLPRSPGRAGHAARPAPRLRVPPPPARSVRSRVGSGPPRCARARSSASGRRRTRPATPTPPTPPTLSGPRLPRAQVLARSRARSRASPSRGSRAAPQCGAGSGASGVEWASSSGSCGAQGRHGEESDEREGGDREGPLETLFGARDVLGVDRAALTSSAVRSGSARVRRSNGRRRRIHRRSLSPAPGAWRERDDSPPPVLLRLA